MDAIVLKYTRQHFGRKKARLISLFVLGKLQFVTLKQFFIRKIFYINIGEIRILLWH